MEETKSDLVVLPWLLEWFPIPMDGFDILRVSLVELGLVLLAIGQRLNLIRLWYKRNQISLLDVDLS